MFDLEELYMENSFGTYCSMVQSFAEKEAKRREKARVLVENNEYMKWLENFTKETPDFCDNDWHYRLDEISKMDSKKVYDLKYLYMGIELYTSANHIYPTSSNSTMYYLIRYNNKVYEIGKVKGKDKVFFCRTKNIDDGNNVIAYENIINPTEEILLRAERITNDLERLSNIFKCLIENNIPITIILEKSQEILKRLDDI